MRLNQFDKLKNNTEALIQNYRQLKYQIIRLEKENNELKSKIDLITQNGGEIDLEELIGLKNENERLSEKSQKVREHLESLVSRLENQKV